MEDHVVEPVVAVHDRNALLFRHGLRQPFHQLFEFGNMLGFGRAILLGPAIDLAGKIIAGFSEIAETDRFGIVGVQFCQRLDLAGEDLAPRFRRLARQRRIPEHPALFHRHDVEVSADHAVVGAQRIGFCDRKTLLAERGDDAEFAVDRVRRRQQFAERPAAHHIGSPGRIEPVGRVGLAALELQDGQRSLIALDVLAHPAVEARSHRSDAAPRPAWCRKTLRRF